MLNPTEIVQKMYAQDAFSKWLGIIIEKIEFGQVHLQMTVRPEMMNGFSIAHGGISYAFADSALAFASNSEGYHAVSIETSISHIHKIQAGDVLRAFAQNISRGRKISIYQVTVTCQEKNVALFKGTVYKNGTIWE